MTGSISTALDGGHAREMNRKLVPRLTAWVEKNLGEVSYYIKLFLTGNSKLKSLNWVRCTTLTAFSAESLTALPLSATSGHHRQKNWKTILAPWHQIILSRKFFLNEETWVKCDNIVLISLQTRKPGISNGFNGLHCPRWWLFTLSSGFGNVYSESDDNNNYYNYLT